MPLLLFYFISHANKIDLNNSFGPVALGLVFSFFGDIFLLFDDNDSAIFFLLGLGSFLLAHVFYIYGFKKLVDSKVKNQRPLVPGLIVLFAIVSLTYLMPSVGGDMKVPVLVYALVITLMVIAAYKLYSSRADKTGLLLFIGALFFIISDSILSISLFKMDSVVPIVRVSIMSTYLLAQFLIATQAKAIFKDHQIN